MMKLSRTIKGLEVVCGWKWKIPQHNIWMHLIEKKMEKTHNFSINRKQEHKMQFPFQVSLSSVFIYFILFCF